jgi:hypothetical protein
MSHPRFRNGSPSEFSQALTKILRLRNVSLDGLRARLLADNKKRRLPRRTIALVCSGQRDMPKVLIAPIARVLELEEGSTQRLYRAAAIDRGYQISGGPDLL